MEYAILNFVHIGWNPGIGRKFDTRKMIVV